MKSTDKEYIYKSLAHTSKSMKVVGRGTLIMDPNEVIESDSFKKMAELSKRIVEEERKSNKN
ncbi:TPA: hypothetical protein U0T37_000469 [Legionella pneumophila]|nr:hypothetical protein [Legionella pneumophila]